METDNKITARYANCRSIWDNDFYALPPALSWTFKIVFNDFMEYKASALGWALTLDDMETLNKAATSISIGERKIEQADLYYGGLSFKQLTRVENTGTFTVKFNEDQQYTITTILEKIYSIYGNDKRYFFNTGGTGSSYPYMGNITPTTSDITTGENAAIGANLRHNIISVKIFIPQRTLNDNPNDYSDTPTGFYKQYKFYNCKFVGVENIDYSYESSDTITRSAVFVYDWMEFNIAYDDSLSRGYTYAGT